MLLINISISCTNKKANYFDRAGTENLEKSGIEQTHLIVLPRDFKVYVYYEFVYRLAAALIYISQEPMLEVGVDVRQFLFWQCHVLFLQQSSKGKDRQIVNLSFAQMCSLYSVSINLVMYCLKVNLGKHLEDWMGNGSNCFFIWLHIRLLRFCAIRSASLTSDWNNYQPWFLDTII